MPNLNGGDGYTFDVNTNIGGLMGRSRYSFNYAPIYNGELLQGGSKDCACKKKKEESLYNILKQNGGYKKQNSQIDAINYISNSLSKLDNTTLSSIIDIVTNYQIHNKNDSIVDDIDTKIGGNSMSSIMAPLGRSNLIVLTALLLLHHFAVEMPQDKKDEKRGGFNNNEKVNIKLSKLLEPLGITRNSSSKLIYELKNAFKEVKNNKSNNDNSISGGSSILKNIIAPLGTSAFIATGLLVILEKIVNHEKLKNNDIYIKKGGMEKENKNINKLIDVITPVSFNIFANKSFVQTLLNKKKNLINNKKGGRGDPLIGFDKHTLNGLGSNGMNLNNISNSSKKNIYDNNINMSSLKEGGNKLKKKSTKKSYSSKNLKGGEESWGATGMPLQFFNDKIKLTEYPANSGFNAQTAYGPQVPLDVGVGMLAPNNTSKASTVNISSMMKTGGSKKSKTTKKKVIKKKDEEKSTKKKKTVKKDEDKVIKKKKKTVKKDDGKVVKKKKTLKKDDKK